MSMSLRDQLLQAGLISAKQAKDADRQQQHEERQQAPKRKDKKTAERRVAAPGAGAKIAGGPAASPQGAPARARGTPAADAIAAPVLRHAPPAQRADPALSAKVARDQALNRKQQEKAQKKALLDQIRLLIEQNRLPPSDGADGFNFIDGNKIRRIPVDASARARLMRGELVIARHAGRYDLVPAAVASRIRERDEHALIALGATPAPAVPQEGYEGFAVPDDLMW